MNFKAAVLVMLVSVVLSAALCSGAEKNYFPSFSDSHTAGLWLFDETDYFYTTITDASVNEYDLRLMKGGRLDKGRFGNALYMSPGDDHAVSYASWKGAIGFVHLREISGKPGSGLYGPTIAPEKLMDAFSKNWTCEFWLKLASNPIKEVTIIDMGNKYEPGFKVTLKQRASGFTVSDSYGGFEAFCPTVLDQLWGRDWHHVAFTYKMGSKKLNYYIDGQMQEAVAISKIDRSKVIKAVRPKSISDTTYDIFHKENRREVPDYEVRKANRYNFSLGHDRKGEMDFNGAIDELRISDIVRYKKDFQMPGSFSRNYNEKPVVANGPALLFGEDNNYEPREGIPLGSRKHVFIDEVMVDRKHDIKLTLNPPGEGVITNQNAAWDASFFEHNGKIYTLVSEGYEGDEAPINLLVSEDGINFDKPDLGLIEYNGSKNNNLVMLGVPSWGKYFKDTNPACPAEELFKATLWVAQRGIYLYFSPDALHWRRNETCMLPLVSGGGCETFWDDQQGVYFNYLKRDGSYNSGEYPNYGRSTAMFKTAEINKPWPFKRMVTPLYEGWAFPAVSGEGVTVMGPDIFDPDQGQIFRTRPQKYEWAPDTYVSFMIRSGCDMGVSRDALNWKICSELGLGHYLDKGETVDGQKFIDGNFANGMIRRGDKIWQWANCQMASGGTKTIRFSQRLDGFMSLDAGMKTGEMITKPFVFEGDKLTLNVAAKGQVKVSITNVVGMEMTGFNVGLTDSPKKPVTGYSLAECDPITVDSVDHVVTWKGKSDLSWLSGKVVRLRFEMTDSKLYSFQFE